MKNEIQKALNWRYATKQFDPEKKIEKEDFDILKEAIRLAPSSYGLQPWKFIIVNNKEMREKLKAAAWGQSQITDASHFIVFCGKTDMDEKYIKEYVHSISKTRNIPQANLKDYEEMMLGFRSQVDKTFIENWTKKQAYVALGFLLESAALLQIDACPMEGFNVAAFDEILGLKEKGFSAAVLCTLGYRSKDDSTSTMKKVRFAHEDVIEEI